MSRLARTIRAVCLLATALTITSGTASAQFTADELQCRKEVAAGSTRATKAILRQIRKCHAARAAGRVNPSTNCGRVSIHSDAFGDFSSKVQSTCAEELPSDTLYFECPSPCDDTVPVISDDLQVSVCMRCLNSQRMTDLAEDSFGSPAEPFEKPIVACHKSILKESARFIGNIMGAVLKCQLKKEKDGATTTTECTDTSYAALTEGMGDDFTSRLTVGPCAAVTFPVAALDGCGSPDSVGALATCLATNSEATARQLITEFLSLPGTVTSTTTTTTSTTTSTTSTTLPLGDLQCPGWAEVTLFSRDTNQECDDNADCAAPRTCSEGRCRSVTDSDFGWIGLAFDNDVNDGDRVRLRLQCDGPPSPGCGQCTVAGIDPAAGNCRCANDPTIACDNPLAAHATECGGQACNCYLGTPTPISAAGAPFCLVPRLASNVTGTVDVDSGAMDIATNVRLQVYRGESTIRPCPMCTGDIVAGDGVRDGTCQAEVGGGGACDASGVNASFDPTTGGSSYSLDCMPSLGSNVSGSGLRLAIDQTTGSSSLSATASCQGVEPGEDCHCLLCSSDSSVACNTDAECAGQPGRCALSTGFAGSCNADEDCNDRDAGYCIESSHRCSQAFSIACAVNADCDSVDLGTCAPSTCSSRGFGDYPLPNRCETFDCTDHGNGVGECATGPDNKFCNGVLEANGNGIFACEDDGGCAADLTGIDAGSCTLVERNACFAPTISATGSSSPSFPVTAATYCMPPTTSPGVNASTGLPGPARRLQQTSLVTFCGGSPASVYTPGVGGCP